MHPYPLIAITALSEAAYYVEGFYGNFICNYDWPETLVKTKKFPEALFTWKSLN